MSICEIIQGYDYSFLDEAELQDQIETVLKDNEVLYKREFRLDNRSRIDFYLPSEKVGIEVKVKSGAAVVSQQLARYAKTDKVDRLILITTRMAHMSLDGTVYGNVRLETIFIGGF